MLVRNDNTAAELLVKEIRHQIRTWDDGRRSRPPTKFWPPCRCPAEDQSREGSGLSRADMRSAREWLRQAARTSPEASGWGVPARGRAQRHADSSEMRNVLGPRVDCSPMVRRSSEAVNACDVDFA
jgi:hypothetical protein